MARCSASCAETRSMERTVDAGTAFFSICGNLECVEVVGVADIIQYYCVDFPPRNRPDNFAPFPVFDGADWAV